jgi:Tol biopolymer transport system component
MLIRSRRAIAAAGCLIGLLAAVLPTHAEAQYFGRNKVQYEKFDFKVLATPHFDIYYYPQFAKAAEEAGRMAERWYARLQRLTNHSLTGRQPIILYADHPDFEQNNIVEGVGEGTGGVTEGARRRVVMPMAATLGDTDHVLGHELVHAFQYDILGPNIEGLPLWFIEGMAEYLSLGPRDVQTAMWLRDAAIEDRLPTIRRLDDPRYFPYRFGHAFWAYMGGRFGDEAVGQILTALAPTGDAGRPSLGDAIEIISLATGKTDDEISAEWHASIRQTYGVEPSPTPRTRPTDVLLIAQRTGSGAVNVGPALSPDGSLIAFLSEKDQLSIDLFLAETNTGRVVRKLVETASDPHFDSLQFLSSAGAWDPDGRRLAIGSIRKGKPALAIIDAQSGDIVQEVRFEELGEIFNPTWAPDGKSLAFSAQVAGVTDLFVHDLSSGTTRRLTNDTYADLQPAWSPDGRRLAFVTDRFRADMTTLAFRGYGLALMTVADGNISAVDTGTTHRAFNPQWSGSDTLYYLGDPDGRSNVFKIELGADRITRVTNERTGVSGITPLSPALSVAANTSRAAMSVFRNGAYEIEFLDTSVGTAPPIDGPLASMDASILPPSTRQSSTVARLLSEPALGLTTTAEFKEQPYSHGMQLVGIGTQAGIASSGQFGTFFGGGIALQFSDMLGNHVIGTGISLNGGVRDLAAGMNYLNRTNRMNWGVYVERAPLLSGTVRAGLTTVDGQVVYVEQSQLYRQTYHQGGFITEYPFSRSMRLELNASARHIGFTQEVHNAYYDPGTGIFLGEERVDLPSSPSIRLFDVGAAIVRDTSAFGATSPVLGQRWRIDFSPTFGDLRMNNVTADFRQYAMPVRPVTFAGRALHVGRYGASGEDTRLTPLFLGYSTLVRGYDVNSFRADECTPTADGSCPEFDRLIGSRILVLNGEVRAPLPGLFRGTLDYGPVPVEILGFFDAGVAWTQSERPSFVNNGTREWVTSAGFGARVNIFGFAIGEFNFAKPLNRPQRGWMFVFNLRPGF